MIASPASIYSLIHLSFHLSFSLSSLSAFITASILSFQAQKLLCQQIIPTLMYFFTYWTAFM